MFATKRTVVKLNTLSNEIIEGVSAGFSNHLGVIIVHAEVADEVVAVGVVFGHGYNL